MPNERILIVGAGPTGLMLAIELARLGIRARIIEKRAEPTHRSRALATFARTLELYDRIGIIDEALRCGRKMHGLVLHAGDRELAEVSMSRLASPFPFVLAIPQSHTERILGEKARAIGVTVERETQLETLRQGEGNCTVQLLRRDGTLENATFDWVVGCDGARSAVRQQVGIRFEGADLHQSFVFADAQVNWAMAPDRVHAFFAPQGVVAAIALPEAGMWRVIASLPEGEAPPKEPTLESIEAMVRTRISDDIRLTDATWVTGFEVRQRKVEAYRAGRVLLAGDAAHAHSPVGGQGMNTGLQDAANLAWKLALVSGGHAEARLLDTYHEEREPIAHGLLRGTGLATRAVALEWPVAQAIRNAVAQFVLGFEAAQDRLIQTMSEIRIDYRGCALSVNASRRTDLRAGDRLPDGTMTLRDGRELRIFGLLREPGFHLFVFADWDETHGNLFVQHARESLRQPLGVPIALHEIDAMDSGYEGWHQSDNAVAWLVRPDGYIGLRISPIDAAPLDDYLALIRRGGS